MEKENFLNDIAALTGIPLAWKNNGATCCSRTPDSHYPFLADALLSREHPLQEGCEQIAQGIHFGYLKNMSAPPGDEVIIAGPIAVDKCGIRQGRELCLSLGIPTSGIGNILSYFSNTPPGSANKVTRLLTVLADVLLDRQLSAGRMLPDLGELPEADPDKDSWEEYAFAYHHDTAQYERTMYSLIRYGNSAGMEAFLKERPYIGNEGHPGSDLMRHYKNAIISSIAIASHSANEGGLAYETAMNLADTYVQNTENAATVKDLYQIHRGMLRTYTLLVEQQKVSGSETMIVSRACTYVQKHLGEDLSVARIAQSLSVSRAYLSHRFVQETGGTLKQYILRMRIDEACRLLAVTQDSLQDIASALGFRSQSHFSTVFHQLTGVSPSQYRSQKKYMTNDL